MKVTYTERIENHNAWSRKMYCPACGAHEYEVVEQLEPEDSEKWYIRCPQCGHEGFGAPTKEIAIGRWKQF